MSDLKDRIAKRRAELAAQGETAPAGGDLKDRIAKRRAELSGGARAQYEAMGFRHVMDANDGAVMQNAEGKRIYTSPGYNTSDPEEVAKIIKGGTVADVVQDDIDRELLAKHPIAARVQEFNQGVPVIGEWMDEAAALVSPGRAQSARALSDAMERQHPIQSGSLNVLGGIASTAPLAIAGAGAKTADWVGRAANPLSRVMRTATAGAVAGAVEGGASGAGRGEGMGRVKGGAFGAGVGGVLGAGLAPVADAVGAGVSALAKRAKRLDVRVIAEEWGLSPQAARVVKGYLANDDMDAAARYFARAGDDAMLGEAGPGTRQALDTAMSAGGDALSKARPRVDTRVQQAGTRWKQTLDATLGTADGGIKGAAKGIAQRSSAARKSAYDFAYSQPTPMAGDAGQALKDVLARIDPGDLQAAIREAGKEARNNGFQNFNLMASVDDAGNVSFTQPPSVMDLDYLARGLANVAQDGTDKLTGGMSAAASRAASQAKALRGVLKDNVRGYDRALKLGGDKIRETEALAMGRKLLSETATVEDVRNAFKDAPEAVMAAARKGLRENLDAVMGRARATIADLEAGNLDFDTGINAVGQSVAALRNLTSGNNMLKVRMVLGADGKRLFKELQNVSDALVLRAGVARGSATAIRQAGQDAMKSEVAPGIARRAVGDMGSPLDMAKGVTQTLAGTDARSLSAQEQRYFAEIADALTRMRGPDAQRALVAVKNAMAGQPMKDADAQLIGRLAASGAFQIHQAPQQSLPR